MAGELTIRDAKEEDLDAVSALLVDAYAQYLPPPRELTAEERAGWDGYKRNIADVWSRAPISSTIVAERDGKLLGSVNYYAPGQADSQDNSSSQDNQGSQDDGSSQDSGSQDDSGN